MFVKIKLTPFTFQQGTHSRELDHCKNKIKTLELSRKELLNRCNSLEKTLVLVNQGFAVSKFENKVKNKSSKYNGQNIEVKDINSDDESSSKRKYFPNHFYLKKCTKCKSFYFFIFRK